MVIITNRIIKFYISTKDKEKNFLKIHLELENKCFCPRKKRKKFKKKTFF